MDFLNFIRPGTRYGNEMYGVDSSSAPIFSPEQNEVKWDDLFGGSKNKKAAQLDPIKESQQEYSSNSKNSLKGVRNSKTLNPRQQMKNSLKQNKTQKVEKTKVSSKSLLWLERAKRIISDIDNNLGKQLPKLQLSLLKY
jgi:hypothetical protein